MEGYGLQGRRGGEEEDDVCVGKRERGNSKRGSVYRKWEEEKGVSGGKERENQECCDGRGRRGKRKRDNVM